MSLFETYPAPEGSGRRPTCCDRLVMRADVDDLLWQYLHEMAHSRVPFTIAVLVALAGSDERYGTVAIAAAIEEGWVAEVEPEGYMTEPTGLYVGRLARKR